MTFPQRSEYVVFVMRIAIGWLLLYDGLMKLTDSTYSPLSYIQNATAFPGFYDWMAQSGNIGWVSLLTVWGPILLGIAILIGFRMRFATITAMVMIALFYFPGLDFPYVTGGGYIVDRNIIYILVLALLYLTRAGEMWGLDAKVEVTIKT